MAGALLGCGCASSVAWCTMNLDVVVAPGDRVLVSVGVATILCTGAVIGATERATTVVEARTAAVGEAATAAVVCWSDRCQAGASCCFPV